LGEIINQKLAHSCGNSTAAMSILLIAATGLLLPQQKLRQPIRAHSRLACVMSAKERGDAQTLTITLTGCSDGIGVGLDDNNCVDLLRPGLPAAKALQLGDKIMQWNGNKMVDKAGEWRMITLTRSLTRSITLTLTLTRRAAHDQGLGLGLELTLTLTLTLTLSTALTLTLTLTR